MRVRRAHMFSQTPTGHNVPMPDDDIERLLREVEQQTQARLPKSGGSSGSELSRAAGDAVSPDSKSPNSGSLRRRSVVTGAVAGVSVFLLFGVAHTLTWWLPIIGPNPFWGAVAGFISAAGATYVWGRRS